MPVPRRASLRRTTQWMPARHPGSGHVVRTGFDQVADELVDEERVARGAAMDLSGQLGASLEHGRDLALVEAGHRHDRHLVLLVQVGQDRRERVARAHLAIAAGGHDQQRCLVAVAHQVA